MDKKILYVEDDETLGFITKENLERKGYEIIHFTNGKEAKHYFNNNQVDLCLLDVMLPQLDGFSLAMHIRQKNHEIPILFLTAKSQKQDKIEGLTLGADDYITKPYSIEELILKIEIFLKRSKIAHHPRTSPDVHIGKYTLQPGNLKLIDDKNEKNLTQREAELLHLLFMQQGELVKRETILQQLWGENDYFAGRSLDVFISRLRKYLKDDKNLKIENRHGLGFSLLIHE